MDLRVLGPVEAYHEGRPLDLGRRRERFLLGVLLMEVGHLVPADRLASLLWEADPPRNAHRSMQIHASRLRAAFKSTGAADVQLISRGQGYLVETDPLFVDAYRFRSAVDQARHLPRPNDVVTTLRDALALWRGPALFGVTSEEVRERLTTGLDDLRLSAAELLYEAELALGRPEQAAVELAELVFRHPTRERLIGLLMTAWHRQGRVRDALDLYQRARADIVEEHGVEPGAQLRSVHMALLRDELAPGQGRRTERPPAQLPAQPGGFTGRECELAQLDALAASDSAAPAIVAVVGSPGVGKTALVVRWARAAADRYPDGQLFIDLRGYDRTRPVRPIEALTYFLRGLAIAPDAIPVQLEEAAALYRSVVAGRRMLVVLDNAGSVDQIGPLLPGTPECTVLITSRDALTDLVARHGARSLVLRGLSRVESYGLLAWVIGSDRAEAEQDLCDELAEACGHLPLALRIAAANIAGQPQSSLSDQVTAFTSTERLTALNAGGDESYSVRGAFTLSFDRLPAVARRVFTMLGLFPGQDLTCATTAALAGIAVDEARTNLERLAAAHLIAERGNDLYASHDLLRLFAQEHARTDLGEDVRSQAFGRLYDHYLALMDAAARTLYPQILRLPFHLVTEVDFADTAAAAAWLDAEHANLVATVVEAGGSGRPDVAYRLADLMRGHLWIRRDVTDWLTMARCGLAAADADGNVEGSISARISFAHAYQCAGHHREAIKAYEDALNRSREAGWLQAQATAIGNLAVIYIAVGSPRQVIDLCQEAIAIYRRLDQPAGEAVNLGTIGLAYLMSGRLRKAHDALTKAVDLHRSTGAVSMLVMSLSHLGDACRELGRFAEAQQHLEDALKHARQVRFRSGEAVGARYLAHLHVDRGQYADGRRHAERALQLSRETDNSFNVAYALNAIGVAHHRAQCPDEAITCHTEALQIARKAGDIHPESEALVGLAAAYHLAGRSDEALEYAQQARASARHLGYRIHETEAVILLARIHTHRGELDQAREDAADAVAIARQTGQRLGLIAARQIVAGLPPADR